MRLGNRTGPSGKTLATRFILLFFILAMPVPAVTAQLASHVVVVSIDGGKPSVIQDLLRKNQMPHLSSILENASVHWTAQTIFPSITLPSHTSMVTGVGPEVHQVYWNDWDPGKGAIQVPSVFSVAKKSGLVTALFAGKEKFRHFDVAGTLDDFAYREGNAVAIAQRAAAFLRARKPNMTLVHFPDADSAGHMYGWGSSHQQSALRRVDQGLGEIVKAVRETPELASDAVLMVTADHGGHLFSHGSNLPHDMQIPWIIWGKGVRKKTLSGSVVTMDTASTALWVLGIERPQNWTGKPVVAAFE